MSQKSGFGQAVQTPSAFIKVFSGGHLQDSLSFDQTVSFLQTIQSSALISKSVSLQATHVLFHAKNGASGGQAHFLVFGSIWNPEGHLRHLRASVSQKSGFGHAMHSPCAFLKFFSGGQTHSFSEADHTVSSWQTTHSRVLLSKAVSQLMQVLLAARYGKSFEHSHFSSITFSTNPFPQVTHSESLADHRLGATHWMQVPLCSWKGVSVGQMHFYVCLLQTLSLGQTRQVPSAKLK